jgi:proteasome lid subunit RPN8/RPN11
VIMFTSSDLALIEGIAKIAAPNEACGLLEGTTGKDEYTVTTVHPSDNLASDPADMFEVDPRLLLRLQRELRDGPTDMIGIYHSHPRGPAAPSATDLAMAWQPELAWVITALTPKPHTAAFQFVGESFEPLEISVT